jgi:hypothetical protein
MARGWIHTVPAPGNEQGWQNEVEGDDQVLGSYATKAEAEEAGRTEVRSCAGARPATVA